MKKKGEPVTVQKTDDELVSEVVAKMRERDSQFADAAATMGYIETVFKGRTRPTDIVNRVMSQFCQ